MRGFGGTDAHLDEASYTMLHHIDDMTELVHALGETQAVIVGHDWGALVAWSAALRWSMSFCSRSWQGSDDGKASRHQ